MVLDFTNWQLAQWILRVILYLSIAICVGGTFSIFFFRSISDYRGTWLRYIQFGGFLGFIASTLYFFIQVGHVVDEGVFSMFDQLIVNVYWDAGQGNALVFRLLGFSSLLICTFIMNNRRSNKVHSDILIYIMVTSLLSLVYAFTFVGHTASEGLIFKSVLVLHVLIASWWLGMLFPLWHLCRDNNGTKIGFFLERFGTIAMAPVIVLILCGVWLTYAITGFSALFNYSYGQWLLAKVATVAFILLLATYHKYHLAPLSSENQNYYPIARSIVVEKIIGVLILSITANFSTFLSPVVL